jgi:hypothetical protein
LKLDPKALQHQKNEAKQDSFGGLYPKKIRAFPHILLLGFP